MITFEEFLINFKKNGDGEYHFTFDELKGFSNKLDHQDQVVLPLIRKLGFDEEIFPILSESIKYPGEY